MPVVSSTVAVALIWRWLYNTDFGLFNSFLGIFGLPSIPWLTSTKWAMPALILLSVWKGMGYHMVIFLAGLQGIDAHLYEAAEIDGATRWSKFWYITLPMLTPTIFFVLITSIIGSFQVFGLALVMTEGGPGYATTTMVLSIYNNAFQWFKMGYAAALAWVLFAIIFAVTLIQVRYQRAWVHYD
jgi:multiple sugar transport system permease protein